ncbi:MAG: lactonase family protein, partial [Acidobacteriaceae bacterium]
VKSTSKLQQPQADRMKKDRRFVYVGTYSAESIDSPSHGEGIYVFELDPETGALLDPKLAVESANPSWLALHPSGKFLYTVNSVSNFEGESGAVSAFAIDRSSGGLQVLNEVSSQGRGPAHMSLDHAGKYAFIANYSAGSITVLPIREDGSLGAPTDTRQDTASVGSQTATNAPRGSFARSGHDAPHAHCIIPSPDNRFVLQTDLGQDRIYVYKFDSRRGKLTPAHVPFISVPTGDGPRHLAFHPNHPWLYSIQEEASTIQYFHYDPETGSLQEEQRISTLPDGFAGTNFTSEIVISKDGRFLYGANRLHDTVVAFSIASDGRLKHIGEVPTLGDYPRHLAIEPDGNFLYSANQRADSITCYRINRETGMPAFTGQYIALGTPACIVFL